MPAELTIEMLNESSDEVTGLIEISDEIYVGTSDGLKRRGSGSNELISVDNLPVVDLSTWRGRLLVARNDRLQDASPQGIRNLSTFGTPPRKVKRMTAISDEILVVAADGTGRDRLYQVIDYAPPNREPEPALSEISLPNGVLLLTSAIVTGSFKRPLNTGDYSNREPKTQTLPVFVKSERFISSDAGTFFTRLNYAAQWQELLSDRPLRHAKAVIFGGVAWFLSDTGAYRFDQFNTIRFDVQSIQAPWWREAFEVTFPGIRLSGLVKPTAIYTGINDASNPYPENFGGGFRCALGETLASDSVLFPVEPSAASGAGTYFTLNPGSRPSYRVVDKWGNRVDRSLPGFVLWSGPAFLALAALGWGLSLILLLVLAPRNILCHMILMNRHVRRYGYLNLVPVVIIIGAIRRHLLKRYIDSISERFGTWRERYVIPAAAFGVDQTWPLLKEHKKLLVHGSSGVGKTAYLHYLAAVFSGPAESRPVGAEKVVPVFIPLSRYRDRRPDDMFHSQLRQFGMVTDPEIAEAMLENGDFIILIDGLNEVEGSVRESVRSFVDEYSGSSLFVVTSQDDDVDMGALRLDVPLLKRHGIELVLRSRLPATLADEAIAQLDDRTCQLLQLPQDLALVIDLFERSGVTEIPSSRRLLYDRVFDSVRKKWEGEEDGHLWDVLCGRTYDALAAKERRIQISDQPAIRHELLQLRLIIERDSEYLFRHEQIHSYVAAQFVVPRWPQLIAKDDSDVTITFAWLPTLLFVTSMISPGETGDFFSALLARERLVAASLYRQWIRIDPDASARSAPWIADFQRRVGAATLDSQP